MDFNPVQIDKAGSLSAVKPYIRFVKSFNTKFADANMDSTGKSNSGNTGESNTNISKVTRGNSNNLTLSVIEMAKIEVVCSRRNGSMNKAQKMGTRRRNWVANGMALQEGKGMLIPGSRKQKARKRSGDRRRKLPVSSDTPVKDFMECNSRDPVTKYADVLVTLP